MGFVLEYVGMEREVVWDMDVRELGAVDDVVLWCLDRHCEMGFRRKKQGGIRNWWCCAAGRLKEMAVGIISIQMWVMVGEGVVVGGGIDMGLFNCVGVKV